jgi:hypothetical protein
MYVIDDVHYFANITDFVLAVKDAQTVSGRRTASMDNDSSFSETANILEAWEKLERGDVSKVGQAVLEGLDKLNLRSNKSVMFNDVVGFAANVPNYLMGVPQTMVNREVKIFQNKIVTILVNTSVSGGTSTETIRKVALKILEVILKLERDGYRVNLYKMIGSTADDGSILGFIKLKDDRERINLQKLMFPLTHPAMQRRLDFRFRECYGRVDVTHEGYGSQYKWNKDFVAKYFKRLCNGDFLYANLHDYQEDWWKSPYIKIK